MPAPTTVDEVVSLVRKSKLLDPSELDGYLAALTDSFDSPAALCARMRADGLLGAFHVEQLLRGKYRGFYLGKYKLIDRIGLGGMGQVFLAEHLNLRRRVAIKVMPPDRAQNEFSRERFLREARAAGQLDHPNLVRAFDVDSEGDVYFLVMEFVDGVSFHDLVSRHGPLDAARAAYYLWQAAHGLAYMSDRGLIHRDVKPANLLVDRDGVVKLLDLGLVRSEAESDDLTRNEGVKILGTADYLAPEQAVECSKVDVRADIYSLGATAFYLLTGRPPFEGAKIAQKLIAHQVQKLRPIRELRPDVPAALAAVIERMLAKRPGERYQTPGEVIAALDAWAYEPPPPPAEHEIPAVIGSGTPSTSSVNLSSGSVRTPRPGTGPGSGSGVRYSHESQLKIGHRSGVRSGIRPPAAAVAELPRQIHDTPALPPVLPASATHGLVGRQSRVAPVAVTDDVVLQPHRPSQLRPRAWMAVAASLALAIAACVVALLTGAVGSRGDAAPLPAEAHDQLGDPAARAVTTSAGRGH
ncbi:MAG TPA: serine/threonine-protein kinase [Fimbriiglobus sp.]|nr:serine/threonine-protein kinase [Fimbriiglobus sp.]